MEGRISSGGKDIMEFILLAAVLKYFQHGGTDCWDVPCQLLRAREHNTVGVTVVDELHM